MKINENKKKIIIFSLEEQKLRAGAWKDKLFIINVLELTMFYSVGKSGETRVYRKGELNENIFKAVGAIFLIYTYL